MWCISSTVLLFTVVAVTSGFDLTGFDVDSAPPSTSLVCDKMVDRNIRLCLVTGKEKTMPNLSLPFDYETQTVNHTHTWFAGSNKTCFQTETVPLYMQTGEHMGIYNSTHLATLDSCDMIIGSYLPSIASYSFHKPKLYLTTTPLPYDHEHRSRYHRYMFGLWPSYHSAVEAVNFFMQFKKSHERGYLDVYVIRFCETLDCTNYVNALSGTLKDNKYIRYMDEYSIHGEVRKLLDLIDKEDQVMDIYNIFNHLREKLTSHDYDVIVLLMDVPDVMTYMKVLNYIFSKAADLERRDTQWLIPDITFGHREDMLEALHDVHVIQSKLTFIQHKPYGECVENGLGIEYRGLLFAVETLKNAFRNLTMDLFSMHNLRKTMRSQRRWLDYDPLATHGIVVRDGTYPRDFSLSFVDYTTTRHHTWCAYETTAVYTNVDNAARQGLGIGVGGFSEAKIIHPRNGTALFYGLVPPDTELEAVVVEDEPFLKQRESGEFEGIAYDIFQELLKTMMSYGIILNLKLRKVDFYGGKNGNSWNGAFGELANNKKTKVALGQISITQQRKQDFAFTPPFGFIHRTYLIRKQEKSHLYLQFARPFTHFVWLCLLLIVVASALYIFLLDRWNPFRDKVPTEYRFTGYESVWYSYLTMCHLSAPFAARNLPIQIFSIFYWFFSMIVVGSYTGNLASTLTDAYFLRPKISNDIAVLPLQREFRFGCVAHSATSNEMMNITAKTGETLYDIIQRRGDFVENYENGFERVRSDKYILIGTSGVMSHFRNTDPDCALELNSESYYDAKQTEIGFAMKKDWHLKDDFSNAMAYLMETGRIAAIYNRWHKQGACVTESKDNHARMDFKTLTGLFIMLAGGLALSYVILAIKLGYLKLTGRTTSIEDEQKAANSIELTEAERSRRPSTVDNGAASNDVQFEPNTPLAVGGPNVLAEHEVDDISEYGTDSLSDYDNAESIRRRM